METQKRGAFSITDAQEAVAFELCHDVKLIQAKRMEDNVIVIITDDVQEYSTSMGGRRKKIRTRRLNIFQNGEKKVGCILETKGVR